MSKAKFYIKRDALEDPHGPFTSNQIKKWASQGSLSPDTFISKDRKKWFRAYDVKGINFPTDEPWFSTDSVQEKACAKVNEYFSIKKLIGLVGSFLLFIGIFVPIVGAPLINLSYYSLGKGRGLDSLISLLAIISLVLVLFEQYKGLYVTGFGCFVIFMYTLIVFMSRISGFQKDMDIFGGNIGFLVSQSICLKWGWIILLVAFVMLIVSASIKESQKKTCFSYNSLSPELIQPTDTPSYNKNKQVISSQTIINKGVQLSHILKRCVSQQISNVKNIFRVCNRKSIFWFLASAIITGVIVFMFIQNDAPIKEYKIAKTEISHSGRNYRTVKNGEEAKGPGNDKEEERVKTEEKKRYSLEENMKSKGYINVDGKWLSHEQMQIEKLKAELEEIKEKNKKFRINVKVMNQTANSFPRWSVDHELRINGQIVDRITNKSTIVSFEGVEVNIGDKISARSIWKNGFGAPGDTPYDKGDWPIVEKRKKQYFIITRQY